VVARYAKSSFRSTVILLIVGATFLNALRYSIIIGYLKPQLHPEKVVRFLNQELKNGDLITVTNIYYSLSILVYLHKPIKIIADQQSVNAAKEYKAAFLTNNIFPIKDFVITENSSLKNYSRLWIIALDSDNLSLLPWIAKDKALNLIKKTYIGNYVIWLYRLA
jgi:hypothetical protein